MIIDSGRADDGHQRRHHYHDIGVMSDLARRIDVHANAGLLLHQWQQAPRMRALVDALQGVVDDHLVKPLEEMEERLRIDVAEGVWLDFIGEQLMLPRPATDMPTDYAFFGFQGSGRWCRLRPGAACDGG